MTPLEHIAAMVTEAQAVDDLLAHHPPPDGTAHLVRGIRQLCGQLLARAGGRVAVGLSGTFAIGKTQLAEILIGQEGLFPQGREPSTGNVVGIRFVQDEGDEPSIEPLSILFLTERQLLDAVSFMASAMGSHMDQAEVVADRSRGWPQVRQLIAGALRHDAQVQNDAIELRRLVDADTEEGRAALGGRQSFELAELARWLELGSADGATGNTLFPLVRRVELVARVPRAIWDLSSVAGRHELELVDFPGRGASRSYNRDRFLLRLEAPNLSSVLLLVNAGHPGERADLEIAHELASLSGSMAVPGLHVVVTKFDRIQLAEARAVLEPPGATVRDHDVTSSHALRVLLDHVTDLAGPSWHPRFLSLAPAHSGVDPDDRRHASEAQSVWTAVAERIEATSGRSPLSQALQELGRDGGIGSVRHLLLHLISDVGVDRLADEVAQIRLQLRAEAEEYCRLLGATPAPQPAVDPVHRAGLDQIKVTIAGLRRKIDTAGRLPRAGDVPLLEQVEEEAGRLVGEWPLWDRLASTIDGARLAVPDDDAVGAALLEDFGRACADIEHYARSSVDTAALRMTHELNLSLGQAVASFRGSFTEPQQAALTRLQPLDMPARDQTIDVPSPEGFGSRLPLAPDRLLPWALPSNGDTNAEQHHVVRLAQSRCQLSAAVANAGSRRALAEWRVFVDRVRAWLEESSDKATRIESELPAVSAAAGFPGGDGPGLAARIRLIVNQPDDTTDLWG